MEPHLSESQSAGIYCLCLIHSSKEARGGLRKGGGLELLQTNTSDPSRSVPGRVRTQTYRVVVIIRTGRHRTPAVSNVSAICHPCAEPNRDSPAPAKRNHRDIITEWTGRILEIELWKNHACPKHLNKHSFENSSFWPRRACGHDWHLTNPPSIGTERTVATFWSFLVLGWIRVTSHRFFRLFFVQERRDGDFSWLPVFSLLSDGYSL